jgi:hypothetical protein
MTNLRLAPPKEGSGLAGAPYDAKIHNSYRLGKETEDIQRYNITLSITGKSLEVVHAEVMRFYNGAWQSLAEASSTNLKPGQSLFLTGSMKETLEVQRDAGCRYIFAYARASGHPRFYSFHTDNEGYGSFSNRTYLKNGNVKYCDTADIPAAGKKLAGKTIRCGFPAW